MSRVNEKDPNKVPRISSYEVIKNWINNNKQVSARCDESFILQHLAFCEFDIEQTKRRITNYNKRRRALPKWFEPQDDSVATGVILEQMSFYCVTFRQDGEIALMVNLLGNCDFNQYSLNQQTNVAVAAASSSFSDVRYQLIGEEVIFDFTGISLHTAFCLTPTYIWKLGSLLMETAPLKINRFHLLNAPSWMNPILFAGIYVTNTIFGENMIINHGTDLKSLYNWIPPKHLPNEFGGTAGSHDKFARETMDLWNRRPS